MSSYYIERWASRNYRLVKQPVTVDEIVEVAQRGLDQMVDVFRENQAAYDSLTNGTRAQNTFNYMQHGGGLNDITGHRRYRYTLSRLNAQDYESESANIDQFNTQLAQHIDTQANFIEQAKMGKLNATSIFVDSMQPQVSAAKVFDGVLCKDCGHVISKTVYKQHLSSLKCMKDTTDRDLREQGWVELDNGPHITAVKSANIPVELRPSGYTMWVEPWVGAAIQSFDKNKGFAGLKLSDYIRKMKPTDEDK